MNRIGQVTIFVVLGISIVIIIGIAVLIRTNNLESRSKSEIGTSLSLSESINDLETIVNFCLNEFSDVVIYDAGKHAGYALIEGYRGLPNGGFGSTTHPLFGKLVYLECNGINQMPTNIAIKTTIEEALEYDLNICLDNFNILQENGWNVEGDELEVSTEISDNGVFIELSVPRRFNKDELSFEIDNFDYVVSNVNFSFYLEKSREIVDETTNLLISILPDLEAKVMRGEITHSDAIQIAINNVEGLLEDFRVQLDGLGYDFFNVTDVSPPAECNEFPTIFLIKNRENNFKYVFGASL